MNLYFYFWKTILINNTCAVSLYIRNKNKQNCITVNKANKKNEINLKHYFISVCYILQSAREITPWHSLHCKDSISRLTAGIQERVPWKAAASLHGLDLMHSSTTIWFPPQPAVSLRGGDRAVRRSSSSPRPADLGPALSASLSINQSLD